MLMPKKVKYRKVQRGRMTGKAWRGSTLSFGDFADQWVCVIRPGKILFEMEGVGLEVAQKAMLLASAKIGIPTKFIKRHGVE
jgi:ribosomal protein L16/L10AE